jgi:hypothetical protein
MMDITDSQIIELAEKCTMMVTDDGSTDSKGERTPLIYTDIESLRKFANEIRQQLASLQPTTSASRVEEREAWLNIKQEAEQAKYQILNGLHSSDCSVHNEPAYPNGPCDCILSQPTSADDAKELLEAAKAVVERWETPLWKDVPATAEYIYRLRDALNAYKPTEGQAMKTINDISLGITSLIEDLLEIKENVSDEVFEHLDAMEAFLEYAIDAADKAEAAKAKAH